MAVDLIERAKRRKQALLAEISRLDSFIAMGEELAQEGGDSGQTEPIATKRQMARRGVGAETVAAAAEIVRDRGSQPTRDLVPLVEERGIEIGGKNKIATLSARLSAGKDVLRLVHGRWELVERRGGTLGLVTVPEEEESADSPTKGLSADSLFHQTKEGRYAAALA